METTRLTAKTPICTTVPAHSPPWRHLWTTHLLDTHWWWCPLLAKTEASTSSPRMPAKNVETLTYWTPSLSRTISAGCLSFLHLHPTTGRRWWIWPRRASYLTPRIWDPRHPPMMSWKILIWIVQPGHMLQITSLKICDISDVQILMTTLQSRNTFYAYLKLVFK